MLFHSVLLMLSPQPLQKARVLGAIYLKGIVVLVENDRGVHGINSRTSVTLLQTAGAIIQKTSLPFAKRVLRIVPPVPRRVGWEKTRSATFHIKFRTDRGMNEVSLVFFF